MANQVISLLETVLSGKAKLVKRAIANGARLEEQDVSGNTALCRAADRGFEEIVSVLLADGACLSAKNHVGRTALHLATERGFKSIVKKLLKKGASPFIRDNFNNSPLDLALKNGNKYILKLFKPFCKDPLSSISIRPKKKLKPNLVKRKKAHPEGNISLFTAAEKGFEEILCTLLQKGVSPNATNSRGKTALHLAAMEGFTSIVHDLLDYGASPFVVDMSGDTPLDLALQRSQLEVANLLIYFINNPDTRDRYSWSFVQNRKKTSGKSIDKFSNDTVCISLQSGAKKIDQRMKRNQAQVMQLLFSIITNIDRHHSRRSVELKQKNTHSDFSYLYLIHATRQRNTELVRKAVVEGSPLEMKDSEGNTALCVAAEMGLYSIVSLLLDHGACVESANHDGRTALHLAAAGGFRAIVEKLLRKNASPFEEEANGLTPLHLAWIRRHRNVTKVLLQAMLKAVHISSNNCEISAVHAVTRGTSYTVQHFDVNNYAKYTTKSQLKYSNNAFDINEILSSIQKRPNVEKQMRVILLDEQRTKKRRYYKLQERRIWQGAEKIVEKLWQRRRVRCEIRRCERKRRENARKRSGVGYEPSHDDIFSKTWPSNVRNVRRSDRRPKHREALRAARAAKNYFASLKRRGRDNQEKRLKWYNFGKFIMTHVELMRSVKSEKRTRKLEPTFLSTSNDLSPGPRILVMMEDLLKVAKTRNNRNNKKAAKKMKKERNFTNKRELLGFLNSREKTSINNAATAVRVAAWKKNENENKTVAKSQNKEKTVKKKERDSLGKKILVDLNTTETTTISNKQTLTKLHLPASDGALETVSLQLEQNPDLESIDKHTNTAAHIPASKKYENDIQPGKNVAVSENDKKIVKMKERNSMGKQLLEDFNATETATTNNQFLRKIHLPVSNGAFGTVSMQLEQNPDVENLNQIANTAAHIPAQMKKEKDFAPDKNVAMSQNYKKIMKKKKERNSMGKPILVDLNTAEKTSTTINHALTKEHLAALDDTFENVSVQLQGNPDVASIDKNGTTAVHFAARGKNEKDLASLLNAGASVDASDKNGRTPLHDAACRGRAQCVRVLLQFGANADAKEKLYGSSPLHLAALRCQYECVKVLIEGGANILITDARGQTPLHVSAWSGHEDCIDILIDRGTPVDIRCNDETGRTALHLAAMKGHFECISILLEKGAEVNCVDRAQRSALHFATRNGHATCVRLLLLRGAAVDLRDKFRDTALHMAALIGNEESISALLERGAVVDLRGRYMRTALHVAAQKGHFRCMQLLLDGGSSVRCADRFMNTALHLAAEGNHVEAVSLLVDASASCSAKNNNGMTPLDVAGGYSVRPILTRKES